MSDENIDPQEKYKCLWEYFYPRPLMYIKSFKKTPDSERNDVVSDILLKIFDNLRKYNQFYSLSTWVYAIARNYILDLYRKNDALDLAVSGGEIDRQAAGGDAVVDAIIQKDIVEECRRCVASLEERDRRLVFLRYYEGLNSKEISRVEGISHNAIRQRLMAVKSRVKKLLGDGYEI